MAKTTTVGFVIIGLFAVTGTSHADQMNMTFGATGVYGEFVHFTYNPVADGNPALINGSTTAGKFGWTVEAGEGPVSFGGRSFNDGDQFSTFCTELTEFISPGSTYTYYSSAIEDMPSYGQIGAPMMAFRAGLLQELFDNHYADATNGISDTIYSDTVEAAAFQVAVWEIVYEDRLLEVNSGGGTPLSVALNVGADNSGLNSFVISQNALVVALADEWLDALNGDVVAGNTLMGFASDSSESLASQDQVAYFIPLPAPVWMAGMGLLGIIIGRKRLRRIAAG
ncbi:MAG: hypothetical protein E2O54_03840 [Gammaproteobacteria bacterium]|nr:MAG: hypothetical protein E2O54_03840 [Gammaproteobacteria bacterium]